MKSEASFSDCGFYRWSLKRTICLGAKTIIFIGLNPSKADAFQDDATLKRILDFCKSWGYGIVVVINLFALISSAPSLLSKSADPIGELNDNQLIFYVKKWSEDPHLDLWFGWGAKGGWKRRDLAVIGLLKTYLTKRAEHFPDAPGPMALGLTSGGYPLHPLYIPRKEALKPFDWQGYLL